MSRPSFFSRSLSRDSSQSNPLLPQHTSTTGSFSLQDLSPREANSRVVSPSPPPSFYRDARASNRGTPSPSPSPSRSKRPARKIQFAAPPPPIATSTFLQTPARPHENTRWDAASSIRPHTPQLLRSRSSNVTDPLLNLERREKAIQRELQDLLDAQSVGLVQGFGAQDEGSEEGSSTPTSRSIHTHTRSGSASRNRNGVVPIRQPKRKPLGLKGARRGLLRDMSELASIKAEEVSILDEEIERRDEVLRLVSTWEKRIEGARETLSSYNDTAGGGEEATELAELQTESSALDHEIREMEDRLLQMRARKRWLGEQIKESVNRREARLSSYRGALREAEGQVKEFLKRPPVPVSVVMGDEEGFYALPPSRRTLGMAREWWVKESGTLRSKKEDTEKEKLALEEGAAMWAEVSGVVNAFENELRSQMKSSGTQDMELFKAQVGKMGPVVDMLKGILGTAEERGWNLLICAVGAELEAFREGQRLLGGVLESREQKDDEEPGGVATNGLDELKDGDVGELERSQVREVERSESVEREESEDDGPNLAELMIESGNGDID